VSPAGTVLLAMAVSTLIIVLAGPGDAGLPKFLGGISLGGIKPAAKK
jgi:hypothetical protein